jgi:hypothetical protein
MQKENKVWNLPSRYTFKEKFIDLRKSHLTEQNNVLLYNKVLKYLIDDEKVVIKTEDFYEPTIEDKTKYIMYV